MSLSLSPTVFLRRTTLVSSSTTFRTGSFLPFSGGLPTPEGTMGCWPLLGNSMSVPRKVKPKARAASAVGACGLERVLLLQFLHDLVVSVEELVDRSTDVA